ncbi:MAG: PKD domain-containing protein, partial [Phycisphaerae bacterium]|nr:PKD domain-containing protein [Phycisphaerae bacterium]
MGTVKRTAGTLACAAVLCSIFGMGARADVIVDNGGAGTSYTGTWEVSGGTKPYGKDSVWARDGAKYKWAFSSQPAGTYEVLMWWSGWSSRASQVPVSIAHSGGSAAVVINQQGGAGQWNSLGVYSFDGSGSVTVTAAYGSTVSTCADAVWFRQHTGNSKPVAYIQWISPETVALGQTVYFSGYGEDPDGEITAYYWVSSIDGQLSTAKSFSTNALSAGTHVITFGVMDNSGQYATASRSVTVSASGPSTVTIDNGDSATSSTGTWLPSGASGYYGSNSLYSRDGTTYTWTFTPPATSVYTLSMWWTEWPSRTNSAKVSIAHADGTATTYINQQANGERWNKIGEYSYTAGKQYKVTITSSSGDASTCADAVRFTQGSQANAPKAQFYAERLRGGAPFSVQFRDQSSSEATQWRWDFGNGQTSTQRNPSHTYTQAGLYTVKLTVTGSGGSNTRTRYDYIDIKPKTTETIYLVDGHAGNDYFIPDVREVMRKLGATEITNGWRYQPSNSNMTYTLRRINDPVAAENALKEQDAHVVLVGHANFGFGMTFVNNSEYINQTIDAIKY